MSNNKHNFCVISLVVKNKVYSLVLFHLDTELISEYNYLGTIVRILSRTGSSAEQFKGSKKQENNFFSSQRWKPVTADSVCSVVLVGSEVGIL
jgi:hypothetical protein